MMYRKHIHSGGILDFDPDFLSHDESDTLFDFLMKNVDWKQNYYTNYRTGEKVPQPRQTAWYADDPTMDYSYSGITESVQFWLPELLDLKYKIENVTRAEYNSVLLNLYRTGKDSVGYHADDESELGTNANIASVSLGHARRFMLEQVSDDPNWKVDPAHKPIAEDLIKYDLTHGSLLVMSGTTQHYWKHSIPKSTKEIGPRINLTFRKFFKV